MHWIEKLEGYFEDIPAHLQEEIRAFLDEYYEKKETHSAVYENGVFKRKIDGKELNDEELIEVLYLVDSYGKNSMEISDRLILSKNLKIFDANVPIKNIEILANFPNLRILNIRGALLDSNKNLLSTKRLSIALKKMPELNVFSVWDGSNESKTEKISLSKNLLIYQVATQINGNIFYNILPENLPNLIDLEISNQNLEIFPKVIHPSILVNLNLSFNNIQGIPSTINRFKNLQYLDMSENELSDLPDELFDLKNLEELNISYNNLTTLSPKIFHLKKLKKISFVGNIFNYPADLKMVSQIMLNQGVVEGQIDFLHLLKNLNQPLQDPDYNYFTLKIPKALQTPMLQYIEFFKDYVEATKGKDIIFNVQRDQEGLVLITNGNIGVTLADLSDYFQEYVSLVHKAPEEWMNYFEIERSVMEADILRVKLERQINSLKSDLSIAQLENKYLTVQLGDKEAQNTFLKDLSSSLSHKIDLLLQGKTPEVLDVDQLLLDIQDQAVRMLERKSSQRLEDLHNDILTEFLRQKGYQATDGTRSGRSKLRVGEIDIMIRKKNGTPFSIIEAFRLKSCGVNNKTVAEHLDKLLHDYDTAGHERNFVIVYAEAKNFVGLWANYQNYLNELNGKSAFRATFPLISFKERTDISNKSSIKIGVAKHRREGTIIEIYHVFINMFG